MILPKELLSQTEQRIDTSPARRKLRSAPRRDIAPPAMAGVKAEAVAAALAAGPEAEAAIGLPPRLRAPFRPAGPTPAERKTMEARNAHLSFAGAVPSPTEFERTIGTNDLVDEFYLERAIVAALPVCRLTVRDGADRIRGYATGFMVSPRLLLTNWHVFRRADEAEHSLAEFDYKYDIRGLEWPSVIFHLDPGKFFHSNSRLDYALVAVSPTSVDGCRPLSDYGYHRLVPQQHKIEEREWITIIQHPGGRRRQFSIRENELIAKDDPDFLWYVSDTAQGSSGAPAFNDSFQIVALHHSGKAKRDGNQYVLKDGSRVPSIDNIDESKVIWEANEGLRVSRLWADMTASLPAGDPCVQELISTVNTGGDIMSRAIGGRESVHATGNGQTAVSAIPMPGLATVQLNIATVNIAAINVGTPAPAASAPPQSAPTTEPPGEAEKLVEPMVDRDYSNREGYDADFLGTHVPMPKASSLDLVAKMENGKHVIPYEHFSIVMNRKRRLALFTASNVDASPDRKAPEPGSYSRKALTGLGDKDQEKWVIDERIPEQFQLPDRFFTNDRQAFDKGHIVRREDVCWGDSRSQVVRANGDTYHATNCSPQVKEFNQSKQQGIWGKLEDFVLKQAKKEKYCIFAGPVLRDDDDEFQGIDNAGKVTVRIPRQYWKIVIARKDDALQAFAFLLEQQLTRVRWEYEFQVDEVWSEHMIAIADLEKLLTGVEFPDAVKNADQYGSVTGEELLRELEISRYGA